MRGLILSPAIDPSLTSSRGKVQGLFLRLNSQAHKGGWARKRTRQFRMILTRTLIQVTSNKLLDKRLRIWDKVITINKRITYDNSKRIRRKIYRAWQQTQSSGSEVQEPARLRLRDGGTAALAGRTLRRGGEVHHTVATGAELRHLYAAAAGPDGRGAAGVRVRRAGARISQKEVQGSGLINRGLRAPSPHTTNTQAHKGSSFEQQALKLRPRRKLTSSGGRKA